jgi:hypothetical protein
MGTELVQQIPELPVGNERRDDLGIGGFDWTVKHVEKRRWLKGHDDMDVLVFGMAVYEEIAAQELSATVPPRFGLLEVKWGDFFPDMDHTQFAAGLFFAVRNQSRGLSEE